MMVLAQTEKNHQVVKARGSNANIPIPCRIQGRAGVWRTEPFGLTKRWRSSVDGEESHRRGRLGRSGERNCRPCFPEMSTEETERSKNGKVFTGPGGEHIKNCGQEVMSV